LQVDTISVRNEPEKKKKKKRKKRKKQFSCQASTAKEGGSLRETQKETKK